MFYKPSFGSLYPALKRLVEKDFLVTYEKMQGANKNLVRIYFYDLLPAQIRNAQLLQYEKDSMQYPENLEKLEKELYEKVDMEKNYYKLSTLFYGITVTKTSIAWCRAIRENVDLKNLL